MINIPRYRKHRSHFFRIETMQVESKNTCIKRTSFFSWWLSSPELYPLLNKVSFITHSSIHPHPLSLAPSHSRRCFFLYSFFCFSLGSAGMLFSSGRQCTTDPCAPPRRLSGTFSPPRDPFYKTMGHKAVHVRSSARWKKRKER